MHWLSNRPGKSSGGEFSITNTTDVPIEHLGERIGAFGTYKMNSLTCCHCNRAVPIKARQDPAEVGGRCWKCDDFVCKQCDGGPCMHRERRLYLYERGILKELPCGPLEIP